jgi:hypothetical protein
MSEKNFYDNFIYNYNQLPWRAQQEQIYGLHLESIMEKLAIDLGDLYYKFKFVIYDHNMYKPIPEFLTQGKDVILIFLSDEKSSVPLDLRDKFFAIFKSYYPLEENLENCIAFPIGYSNSAALTEFVQFEDREYDASFAGNFLSNRLDFYRYFTFLKWLPPFQVKINFLKKIYFKALTKLKLFRSREFRGNFGNSRVFWSDGFAKGLPRGEYARIISETKIALCPKGFMSTECYRLLETMRLGCVVVADELPPSRWYKNSPIIVTTNWLNIEKTVNDLLSSPERMLEIHKNMLMWWNNVCSDDAVASYLADEVRKLEYGR